MIVGIVVFGGLLAALYYVEGPVGAKRGSKESLRSFRFRQVDRVLRRRG